MSDTSLSNSATPRFSASSMTKLPQQAGNAVLDHFQERKLQNLSPEIEKLCFTCSEKKKKKQILQIIKRWIFLIRNSECKKEVDFRCRQSVFFPGTGKSLMKNPELSHLVYLLYLLPSCPFSLTRTIMMKHEALTRSQPEVVN
ncbi:probable ATP-dependent DNA helicase HFM1 [Macaca nemestrina]|uniref:probable ATP-dependent DNA helicase HFM1 n=1 Tax=Macaca nemestrina TaxID=9545 RepID=UPI0039B8AC52